jgi:hypothetical protein
MPRIVRTARGEQVDFDTIVIKQQLAQAPMNVEVARRKEFIDSKEGKQRGQRTGNITVDGQIEQSYFVDNAPVRATAEQAAAIAESAQPADFELEQTPPVVTTKKSKQPIEPIPIIAER